MTRYRLNWFSLLRLSGVVLFVIVVSRTDMDLLWRWLKGMDARSLVYAVLFQFLLLFFKSLRWLWLNQENLQVRSVYQRFGEFLEAYALGVVTPGRIGEVLKAGHAGSRAGKIRSGLLVLSERGLDLSLFVFIAGLSVALGVNTVFNAVAGLVLILAAVAGAALSFTLLINPGPVRFAQRVMRQCRIISKDHELEFDKKTGSYLLSFAGLTLLSTASAFLSFFFIAESVRLNLGFLGVSGSVAMAGVVNTIPVSIMGLGTREVTLLYVLDALPREQVLAFSGMILLVSQVGGGLMALISGQFFLFKAGKRKS